MSRSESPNRQQADQWNQVSGPVWVEQQALLDRMLAPFAQRLVEEAFPGEGRKVLDIGCGAGATTLAMAERLGPGGLCLGVDISAPLIAAARARATAGGPASAAFALADAQTFAFERQAFDAVISRFGVMFFDDPAGAFGNIRAAAAPGARLAFSAWRSAAESPFMTAAARATAPLLPPQPPPAPDAPGQFGFADPARVRRILEESGWRQVRIEPLDEPCVISDDDLMTYVMNMGPSGAALRAADAATRDKARSLLEAAFRPYVDGDHARFIAACWWGTARA
jgi:SAM-dependent methyltransferase